ncbi:MAG: flagellar basal body-associated FliL family protein [Bdellovibrionaceae bacterium]|nr:flagellar basal body-associated FliL family protein [Pseudobdellovibrionaceae bacterium]
MADNNAAKKMEEAPKDNGADAGPGKDRKPLVLMILIIVNSLALLGVGAGLYMYSQATRKALKQETEIADTAEAHGEEKKETAAKDEAKMVPLESFIINLNGSEGYKFMKITMTLEVDSTATQEEITKRQAQVKDTIVVLLTSKSYSEVAGENGQQKLKEELVDTINSFLVKGKIKKILFTDFLFQ